MPPKSKILHYNSTYLDIFLHEFIYLRNFLFQENLIKIFLWRREIATVNISSAGGNNMETKNISFLDGIDTEKRIGEFISKQRKAIEITIEELSEISEVWKLLLRYC